MFLLGKWIFNDIRIEMWTFILHIAGVCFLPQVDIYGSVLDCRLSL